MSSQDNFEIKVHKLANSDINNYPSIAENFTKLGKINEAVMVMNLYEKLSSNKPLSYITCGNFYNIFLKDYKTAISYYEKYIELDNTKSVVYTILANLYLKLYGDKSREQQLKYLQIANELCPHDRKILSALAFCYRKVCLNQEAKKYYEELMKCNPLPIDYFNYGALLINCGDFINGHKYFKYRNLMTQARECTSLTPDIESLQKLETDLSDKTLLVHYEEGFGDTIMYCRFMPELKQIAQKVIFIVQNSLYSIIKSSKVFNEIEIYPENIDIQKLKYDIPVMLLDIPLLIHARLNKKFFDSNGFYVPPYETKYLDIKKADMIEYAKQNLSNDKKFKIGIAYSGNKTSNYQERDIDIKYFTHLTEMENVQLYSLQKQDFNLISNIIPLGESFNNFYDTACAVKNMDLIISTDNVILNIAGALGVRTIGLFNKYTNYRWYKLSGEDTGWYKSVKPIHATEQDDWNGVFSKLTEELELLISSTTLSD